MTTTNAKQMTTLYGRTEAIHRIMELAEDDKLGGDLYHALQALGVERGEFERAGGW